jgi:hypothetical protein
MFFHEFLSTAKKKKRLGHHTKKTQKAKTISYAKFYRDC